MMLELPSPTPEYAHLAAIQGPFPVVYRYRSRRLGQTLAINLLGDDRKVCSFDCAYCEYGSTKVKMSETKRSGFFEGPDLLMTKIQEGFRKTLDEGWVPEAIAFVGTGEATLHPDFDLIAQRTRDLRDTMFAGITLATLSNGSQLDSRKVVRGLSFMDLRLIKLDAGNDRTLKKINAPLVKEAMDFLIAGARKAGRITIQSCFIQGEVDNTRDDDLEEWMEAIGMIQPIGVHLFTIDRIPARPGLKRVEEDTLYTIQAKLEKRTRIKAKVFFSP